MGSEVGVFGVQAQFLTNIVPVGDHRADRDAKDPGNLSLSGFLLNQIGSFACFY